MAIAGHWKVAGRLAAVAVGVALLAAALHAAAGHVDLATLRAARPLPVLGLLLGVLANLMLTGALFWTVTLPFDARPPVRLGPMVALIAASSLLNYLPLRPGLLGRAAYLKLRHELPVSQSVLIFVVVAAVSGFVQCLCALAVLANLAGSAEWSLLGAVGLLLALAPFTSVLATRLLRRPVRGGWLWVVIKIADMLVGGARLWLAFSIVNHPVPYSVAVAMASVGMFANFIVPVIPNGLGVREWMVGGVAALMLPMSAGTGVAATLVDRAAEALVCLLCGVPAVIWLRRTSAKVSGAGPASVTPAAATLPEAADRA